MAASSQTVAAMSANNVTLTGHQIARRKPADPVTDAVHDSDKFMTNDHRNGNCLL